METSGEGKADEQGEKEEGKKEEEDGWRHQVFRVS